MFPIYNSLAEVPEAFREHYVLKGGKAVAEVSSDHPLVVNNATLLSEKQAAETKATAAEAKASGLQADLESAKAGSLPRGHVAVPKADADLLNEYKPLGEPKVLKVIVDEHGTLKATEAARQKQDRLKVAASASGFDPDKVAALDDRFPEVLSRDVEANGKTTPQYYFRIKDGDKEIEKSFADYVATDEKLKPLADGLKTTGGAVTRVTAQGTGGAIAAPNAVKTMLSKNYPKPGAHEAAA